MLGLQERLTTFNPGKDIRIEVAAILGIQLVLERSENECQLIALDKSTLYSVCKSDDDRKSNLSFGLKWFVVL